MQYIQKVHCFLGISPKRFPCKNLLNGVKCYCCVGNGTAFSSVLAGRRKTGKRGAKKMTETITEYWVIENHKDGEVMFGITGKNILTKETFEIGFIGSDRKLVDRLAEKLNRNDVSLSHFYDVVRDFVYENSVLVMDPQP